MRTLSKPFDNYKISRDGTLKKKTTSGFKVVKGCKPNPYVKFTLTGTNGQRAYKRRHVLVARTFLGKPKPGQVVDHINRNKTDDRVENLRYISKSENRRTTWGGVKFIPEHNAWGVRIHHKSLPKKYVYIGNFPTKQAALVGKRKYLQENFPDLLKR